MINGSHEGPISLRISWSLGSVYTSVLVRPLPTAKNFLIKVCYFGTLTQQDFSPGQSDRDFPHTPECVWLFEWAEKLCVLQSNVPEPATTRPTLLLMPRRSENAGRCWNYPVCL